MNESETHSSIVHAARGYAHPAYAASLVEFGKPLALKRSGGHLLVRRIPGSDATDLIGCYPLFACAEWSQLRADIEELRRDHVSLGLVADPFGNHNKAMLRDTFDSISGFKSHFIIELDRPPGEIASSHHRYYARKALARVSVEVVGHPPGLHSDWCGLYENLIRRHGLTGIKAFSRTAFQEQLQMADLIALRAVHEGRTIGAHLWMVSGDVASSHLTAFSQEGYDLMCAYALYWEAIRHFTGKVRWLNIGAGAGMQADAKDGLTQFKRGWSTSTRTAWFCSSVLQPEKYAALCAASGAAGHASFPAYRRGRFD